MSNSEKFGAMLRLLRTRHKLSQSQVAKLLSVTNAQISEIEAGKTSTSIEKLVRLAIFFDFHLITW